MYPVAKNYFWCFIQAHSFSGYVPTFAFLDHVEMKGCSKPLTHPECRPQHQKQAAARGSSEAEFCACRAIPGGTTKLCPRATAGEMQPFLGCGKTWRGRKGLPRQQGWCDNPSLSRQWEWRDQRNLPRNQVKNAVLSGLWHSMARQCGFVAPTTLARQAYSVAPSGVGSCAICSPFWSWAIIGAARLFCRATHTGATRHLLPAACFKFVSLNPSWYMFW